MNEHDYLKYYYGFRIPSEFVDEETGFVKKEMLKWLRNSCKDKFELETFFDRCPNGKIGYAATVYLKNVDDATIYRLFWT